MSTVTEKILSAFGNEFFQYAETVPDASWFDEGVVAACRQNYCGKYGKSWTCPPGGDPAAAQKKLLTYGRALVFTTKGDLEDSFDIEGMTAHHHRHDLLTRRVFEFVKDLDVTVLGAGSCTRCEKCTYPLAPCRFPDEALKAMEGAGINVMALSKKIGINYINGTNTVTYFSAVFFNEAPAKDRAAWIKNVLDEEDPAPLPILSYPACPLLGISVLDAVKDSDLQVRMIKAVADRCRTSAAVTLMDLSVEAECFGAKVDFREGMIPAVTGNLITSAEQIASLEVPAVGVCRSGLFVDTVRKAKKVITDRPLLCGAAAPFSLAGRLLGVTESMYWCFDEPDAVKQLLDKCTEFIISFVKAMKEAGADGVILAEPVAGLLSPALEEEFSAPYVRRIAEELRGGDFAVIYHNCGQNVPRMTGSLFKNGCDAYHFGNASDLVPLLEKAPSDVLVMGNIDPVRYFRDGTPEEMTAVVKELKSRCRSFKNFVLSSGCDIPPAAKWENIDAFFTAAQ